MFPETAINLAHTCSLVKLFLAHYRIQRDPAILDEIAGALKGNSI